MKSLASCLLKVVEGILTDYTLSYPADIKDSVRDLSRLTLLVKARGLGVFTLSLPELDSLLLQGLKTGRLPLGCPLSKRASARIHVPRLFRGMWLRVFDVSGHLIDDPDPNAILFLRQLCCVGKKVEVGCAHHRTESVLDEYRKVESSLHVPTLRWDDDYLGSDDAISSNRLDDSSTRSVWSEQPDLWDQRSCNSERSHLTDLIRKCQRNFDAFAASLGFYDPGSFSDSIAEHTGGIGFRHGPGAVADGQKKDFKYDFPFWPRKLSGLFPYSGFGVTYHESRSPRSRDSDNVPPCFPGIEMLESVGIPDLPLYNGRPESDFPDDREIDHPRVSEPLSRLIAVPKTAKGPRLIACEPTAHQWCQQLTARFIIERSKTLFGNNFVTINDQGPSKEFARNASLTGSECTVDLSSASDRLSCWLVERAYRSNPSILRALHSHRTRGLSNQISGSEYFLLKKFATQGTAVTFPVQSFVFLIIALTAVGLDCKNRDDIIVGRGNWIDKMVNKVRVFGDDIIIPTHGYDNLVLLLTTFGLKVNSEKSFATGLFRESCGGDYFAGHDVTPVKTKSLGTTDPASRQSLISYSNNLFEKGFWHAAKVVESIIPAWIARSLPVTRHDSGGIGLTSFVGPSISHLSKRWNKELQRDEVRMYACNSIVRRKSTNSTNAVLQYFSEAPLATTKWSHGIASVPKTRDGLKWEFPHFA